MRGVSIGFGPGPHITVDDAGKFQFDTQWQFWYDVAPTWMRLALNHARTAEQHRSDRIAAWSQNDDQRKADTLELECAASMQATMAAAIAVDALYASVHPLIALPPVLIETWQRKKTARAVQISETLRRAFKLSKLNATEVRSNLVQLFKLRDMAVHPRAHLQPAVLHPELGVALEWRFDAFRAHNACLLVTATAMVFWFLTHKATPINKQLNNYIANLRVFIDELLPNGPIQVAPNLPK